MTALTNSIRNLYKLDKHKNTVCYLQIVLLKEHMHSVCINKYLRKYVDKINLKMGVNYLDKIFDNKRGVNFSTIQRYLQIDDIYISKFELD